MTMSIVMFLMLSTMMLLLQLRLILPLLLLLLMMMMMMMMVYTRACVRACGFVWCCRADHAHEQCARCGIASLGVPQQTQAAASVCAIC